MRKLVGLFVLVFVSAIPVFSQNASGKETRDVLLKNWHTMPQKDKKIFLEISSLSLVFSSGGIGSRLLSHELKESYPQGGINGAGIGYEAVMTRKANGKKLAVRIMKTLKRGPAETAGILPGDWLVAVDNFYACDQPEPWDKLNEVDLQKECTDRVRRLIRNSCCADVVLSIEREGKQLQFTVKKTTYGFETAKFVSENLPRWLKQRKDMEVPVDKFGKNIDSVLDAKKTDQKKLDDLFLEYLSLQDEADLPYNEINKFEEKLWNKQ